MEMTFCSTTLVSTQAFRTGEVAFTAATRDLPLNFHPAAIRASTDVTPFGAISVPA
jgi:hypothetical protein